MAIQHGKLKRNLTEKMQLCSRTYHMCVTQDTYLRAVPVHDCYLSTLYFIYYIHAAIFTWPCVLLDHPPMLWWLSSGEGRDGVTCGWDKTVKSAQLLKIKEQVSSIWAKHLNHCLPAKIFFMTEMTSGAFTWGFWIFKTTF